LLALVREGIAEVLSQRADSHTGGTRHFFVVDCRDTAIDSHILATMANCQPRPRAGSASSGTQPAIIVVGRNYQIVILPRGTDSGAIVVDLVQKVVEGALEAVGGRGGASHALGGTG
jgi:hypothetical protein